MPPRKKQTQKSIEAYDHVGQDRLNNQPVGLVDSNNDLNQSQGGRCISGVLKTTGKTPRYLISPSDLNWG